MYLSCIFDVRYFGIFVEVLFRYFRLFWGILGYFRVFLGIWGYFQISANPNPPGVQGPIRKFWGTLLFSGFFEVNTPMVDVEHSDRSM